MVFSEFGELIAQKHIEYFECLVLWLVVEFTLNGDIFSYFMDRLLQSTFTEIKIEIKIALPECMG